MKEVIEYLELNEDNKETGEKISTVKVPDITYKSLKNAEEILKQNDLSIEYEGDINKNEKENIIIKQQIPSSGITINSGSKVKVYLK